MTSNSALTNQLPQFIILLVFVFLMYFILIKPQKKKDQETQDMRNSIKPGDEVTTIGGIIGKVVRTTEDSVVIQVGADRTKFEVKKWGISSIDKKSQTTSKKPEQETPAPQEEKKVKPKRLGKKAESMEEELKEEASEAVQQAENAASEVEAAASEVIE